MYVAPTQSVTPGTRLGATVFGPSGQPLLHAGVCLTEQYLADLRARRVPSVYVSDPDTADVEVPQPITAETRARAVQNLDKAFSAVSEACEGLRRASVEAVLAHLQSDRFTSTIRAAGGLEAIGGITSDADAFVEQLMRREVLVGLNSIKSHDAYTYQHSIDVTIMGVVLARCAGWDRRRVRDFAVGCLLHDVGKIFIEAEILNKQGKLSADEFARVRAHPSLGYSVIKAIAPGLGALVPQVAYQHHEKQDGSGYPRGLRGENTLGVNTAGHIHDFGAICAVADVYDAIGSDRPYRAAMPADRVVNLIRGMAGTHLNRLAVQLFAAAVPPYPVCSRVRVCNGRYAFYEGVVVHVLPRALARPRVRLLWDAMRERVDPVELDLAEEKDVQVESVGANGTSAVSVSASGATVKPAKAA